MRIINNIYLTEQNKEKLMDIITGESISGIQWYSRYSMWWCLRKTYLHLHGKNTSPSASVDGPKLACELTAGQVWTLTQVDFLNERFS